MGKKLGLDDLYKSIGVFPKNTNTFMERRLKIGAGSGTSSTLFKERALKLKAGQPLTTSVNKGSKLLNVGKKVFGRTPIGKAVNLAIAAGTGANIGYEYGKDKFKSFKEDIKRVTGYKTDKKMGGGMMQGYGAARTSGMGLEDQSLMPGQMVRASKGKMLSAKQKKIARMAPPPDKITGADFKAMKAKNGKMVKMNKGGGMDMGNTSARTTAYAKAMAKKDDDRLTENDIANVNTSDFRARVMKYAQKNKGEDRVTQADIKMAEKFLKKNR
jgi:hypothetical protein